MQRVAHFFEGENHDRDSHVRDGLRTRPFDVVPKEIQMKMFRNAVLPLAVLGLGVVVHGARAAGPDMKALMLRGHEKMMAVEMTGKADVDFAIAMREHHVGALEMAQWEIDNGKDPKMKEMARKIIAAQKKEIAEFDDFLARAGHKPAGGASSGAHAGHQK